MIPGNECGLLTSALHGCRSAHQLCHSRQMAAENRLRLGQYKVGLIRGPSVKVKGGEAGKGEPLHRSCLLLDLRTQTHVT